MPTLTKHEIVLEFHLNTGMRVWFESQDPEGFPWRDMHALPTEVWEEMGSPSFVTVTVQPGVAITVQPGDTINV